MFEDNSQVWPDDIYPFRYGIKLIEQQHNVPFGQEFFSKEFVEAVQQSTLRKGLAIDIPNLNLPTHDPVQSSTYEVSEGKPVYKSHLTRERNPEIIRAKKAEAKRLYGTLSCEACGFNFEDIYGERGADFIECHHTNPLSATEGTRTTNLKDLALLCSNCHRMIHRSKLWITVEKLKSSMNERH
ncbi:hypothetical protein CWN84_10120 [Vibrio splendidus]|nr:hypothetical protein CWN84_10120 [Vibrio splendidus]